MQQYPLDISIRINFDTVPERYRDIAKQLGLSVDNVSNFLLLEMIIERIVSIRSSLEYFPPQSKWLA